MSTWFRSSRARSGFRSGLLAKKSTITSRVHVTWSVHSLSIASCNATTLASDGACAEPARAVPAPAAASATAAARAAAAAAAARSGVRADVGVILLVPPRRVVRARLELTAPLVARRRRRLTRPGVRVRAARDTNGRGQRRRGDGMAAGCARRRRRRVAARAAARGRLPGTAGDGARVRPAPRPARADPARRARLRAGARGPDRRSRRAAAPLRAAAPPRTATVVGPLRSDSGRYGHLAGAPGTSAGVGAGAGTGSLTGSTRTLLCGFPIFIGHLLSTTARRRALPGTAPAPRRARRAPGRRRRRARWRAREGPSGGGRSAARSR